MFKKAFKGTAPDYSESKNWLELPENPDKKADLIYLYPSSCNDLAADTICDIDNISMIEGAKRNYAQQATAFEPFTNIYAPYWRQVNALKLPMMSFEEVDDAEWSEPRTDVYAALDNYFENLKDVKKTKASSHFIIGLEGEIIQCVPTWEIAYASNHRNSDTVSIETCHKTSDGTYTKETYESMVELTAWLCEKFHLTEEDIIRHYDITGKICPKYFVEDEKAWEQFKQDVKKVLEER